MQPIVRLSTIQVVMERSLRHFPKTVPALALSTTLVFGCSKDPPREENFSGLKPPVQFAAEALDGLPDAREPEPLLTPLIMAVTASATDGTSFGLAPVRQGIGQPTPRLGPFLRFPSQCPRSCPRVTVDDEACKPGKPILPAPPRSPGNGITFERRVSFDWKEGCIDEESQTFVAGKTVAVLKVSGVGLLLSDNPDELDFRVETTIDVRYREDLLASLRGGLHGTFAGGKTGDGRTFQGSGGLALDMTLEDPVLLPPEDPSWILELDERIEIEKIASKPDLVYTTTLRGRGRTGTPARGRVTAFIDDVVRTWGFRGEAIVGCLDEPVSGALVLEQPRGLEADFAEHRCDCEAELIGGRGPRTIDTCRSATGELLARSVRYLLQLEDFPVVGRSGNPSATSRR